MALGGIFRRASCCPFFAVFHLVYLRTSSPAGTCAFVRARAFSRHTDARGTFEFDLRPARCSYVLSLRSESRRAPSVFWKIICTGDSDTNFENALGRLAVISRWFIYDFRSWEHLQKWTEISLNDNFIRKGILRINCSPWRRREKRWKTEKLKLHRYLTPYFTESRRIHFHKIFTSPRSMRNLFKLLTRTFGIRYFPRYFCRRIVTYNIFDLVNFPDILRTVESEFIFI